MVDTSEWLQDHHDAVLWPDVFDVAKGSKTRDMLAGIPLHVTSVLKLFNKRAWQRAAARGIAIADQFGLAGAFLVSRHDPAARRWRNASETHGLHQILRKRAWTLGDGTFRVQWLNPAQNACTVRFQTRPFSSLERYALIIGRRRSVRDARASLARRRLTTHSRL
ncbi:hypothetical protein [Caballeronia sp. 15711]|uniref:hypothetical protein n=1 Tax=Caballeronia sp. 15711 TaxID=3391029 RepID=UPI0039E6BF35